MRRYRLGRHARCDPEAHLIRTPKYRFAVTSGTITEDMIDDRIDEQEGEPVENDGRFQIDLS